MEKDIYKREDHEKPNFGKKSSENHNMYSSEGFGGMREDNSSDNSSPIKRRDLDSPSPVQSPERKVETPSPKKAEIKRFDQKTMEEVG